MKSIAFSLLILYASSALAATAQRPHIVLVMSDDHGYGDTGYTGHPFVKTPYLDALAEEGVVFSRFYAAAPVCSPTRASFMTGRHPFRTNVPNHGHYMRPQEITLAEALKAAGYVTGHFGKWHIGSVQADSPTSPGGAGFDEWLSGLNFFDNNPYLSRNGKYEQILGGGTVVSTDATIDFLKKHKDGDKPMLSVTWLPAPHDPHQETQAGTKNATLYDEHGKSQAGYFREITLLDEQVGRIRDCLRQLQIENNTLFLYCSDNGGLVAKSSGGRERKGSIYEGGLRVPAIISWPAKYPSKTIDTPVFTCDLYPTLLAVAGAQVQSQPQLDGIDLSEVIAGSATARPPMGFWHGHTAGQATWSDRIIKKMMVAQQAGKPTPHPERFLKNVNQFPTFAPGDLHGHAAWSDWPWKLHRIQQGTTIKLELYHLLDDPMESTDLSRKQPSRAERMLAELESWQESVLASWSGSDYAK